MVGVGSGSALNAFNIGQQATQPTAIGQQITAIVEEGSKKGLLETQSAAQSAGSLAVQQAKTLQEKAPIEQYWLNPTSGVMESKGMRPGNSAFSAPALTESYIKADILRQEAAEDAAAAVQQPGGNVQNVGQNASVSPFNVAGQGAPAPVATAGAQQLKSPEFQGLDPAIFQTPEGQAALRRIIDEKMRAAGGGTI